MSESDVVSVEQVSSILEGFKDPESGRSLKASNQIHNVSANNHEIKVEIGLTSHSAMLRPVIQEKIQSALRDQFGNVEKISVDIVTHYRKPMPLGTIGLNCKSVIAVGSGKGGVGKSTVSTCLALALKRAGCAVGLLDADVYGPSIPQLTGVNGHPSEVDGKIEPIDFDGMPVMSIGFMVPPDQAVIWRGPMLHSAVTRFLRDTAWGELDYLIIDMPPGTGDIALTLSQLIPLTGSVVVCTPQKVALLDAIKAVAMFQKVKIPVLGMVENMSTFVCPDNGKRYDIFGNGGARKFATEAGVPFLGELPINIQLRQRGDQGTTVANLDDDQVEPYVHQIALNLCQHLATLTEAAPPKPTLPVLG